MKKAISLGVAAAMTATLLAGCGTAASSSAATSSAATSRGCFHLLKASAAESLAGGCPQRGPPRSTPPILSS